MATQELKNLISEPAAADLSTKQYLIVRETATGINVVTAATQRPIGVLDNDPVAGEAAGVQVIGIAKIICGAAITKGARVMADTSARAIPAATGAANYVLGVAMTATANAGELVEVLLGVGEVLA